MNIGKKREDFRNWLYLGQTFGRVGNSITRIMQKIKGKHMSATHEVDDSEFEKWWTQFKSDEFRLAESGWTEKEIAKLAWRAAIKAIEQAVLQSPEIQAMRKDAERYRWLLKNEDGISISMTFEGNTGATPYINGEELEKAIDAAMENQE